ncbi:Uncharacterised protein [Candidatus Norongarragalina meridionalis]|nr:Uncharacterised protein [Candidatus Norongarragalina meridionalis]
MLTDDMKRRLESFVADDVEKGDVTGALVPLREIKAKIVTREKCTLAGIEEVAFIFEKHGLTVKTLKRDGEKARKSDAIMRISGLNRSLYETERVALNIMSRMSGIATACAEAARLAAPVKVAVTRKTTPGFSVFEKKAAVLGEALPHRADLSEMILLKRQHLREMGGIRKAAVAVREKHGVFEAEVSSVAEAVAAAEAGVPIIMLDNMPIKEAKRAVAEIRKKGNAAIEISGGITPANLKKYAALKPDFVSMGSLTRDARGVDFSMVTE